MKQITNAVKQFFRISFAWWTPLVALAEAGGFMLIALMMLSMSEVQPVSPMDSVIICTYLHTFVPGFFLLGTMRSADNKFFSVSTYAKSFYTCVPIISSLIISLPIDIILYIVLDSSLNAEKLIINSLNTVFICFFVSSTNKSGQQIAGLIAYIIYTLQFRLWFSPALINGFSLSVPAASAIALIIYTGGTALNLFTAYMWWEKSRRNTGGKNGVSRDISTIKKILCFLDN